VDCFSVATFVFLCVSVVDRSAKTHHRSKEISKDAQRCLKSSSPDESIESPLT